MGLPGASIGNVSDPAFAKIKQVFDELIDAVEQIARERRIARGFFPILCPANFAIIADMRSIHVVYTNTSAGGIPAVNVTDLTQKGILVSFRGEDAGQLVERELGYRGCQVITVSRSLEEKSKEEQKVAMLEEAQDYLNFLLALEQQQRADQEARALLALPLDTAKIGLLAGVKAAIADQPHDRSVFVMMRYLESDNYAAIESATVRELEAYGLTVRLAKNKAYSDDLWDNVRIYMHASKYGVAVFEEIDERKFNPNVSMELGYMYALGKRVLLLKDKRMPTLPTDIVGRIYRPFDTYNIAATIKTQIKAWAENDLGLICR